MTTTLGDQQRDSSWDDETRSDFLDNLGNQGLSQPSDSSFANVVPFPLTKPQDHREVESVPVLQPQASSRPMTVAVQHPQTQRLNPMQSNRVPVPLTQRQDLRVPDTNLIFPQQDQRESSGTPQAHQLQYQPQFQQPQLQYPIATATQMESRVTRMVLEILGTAVAGAALMCLFVMMAILVASSDAGYFIPAALAVLATSVISSCVWYWATKGRR